MCDLGPSDDRPMVGLCVMAFVLIVGAAVGIVGYQTDKDRAKTSPVPVEAPREIGWDLRRDGERMHLRSLTVKDKDGRVFVLQEPVDLVPKR